MSTTADLILKGGKVVSPGSVIDAAVAIKDGKILSVGAFEAMPAAKETVDVSGMHTSAIPATRRRKTSRAARALRRSAASPPCSTCRTRSRLSPRRKCLPPS
jgi:hypothetical protein